MLGKIVGDRYSTAGGTVSVKVKDKTIEAVAGNDITTTNVWVVCDGDNCLAYGTSPPETRLSFKEVFRSLPEKKEEKEEIVILPFQVLYNSLFLSGDRVETLVVLNNIITGGITNLGQQEYWIVYLSDLNITQDRNGVISLFSIPTSALLTTTDYFHLGAGILATALLITEKPAENFTVITTGQPLPPDVNEPFYPVFGTRFFNTRVGGQTDQQADVGYSYQDIKTWDYNNQNLGNSDTPTPSTFEVTGVCNFTNSGVQEQRSYDRRTQLAYDQSLTETFNAPVELYWNNQGYIAEQSEVNSKTFNYNQVPAVFNANTTFSCVLIAGSGQFGLYDWRASFTDANWSGESITSETIESNSTNHQLEVPIAIGATKEISYSFNREFQETKNVNTPSENWFIPNGAAVGFLFQVTSSETIASTETTIENSVTLKPHILAETESFFSELTNQSTIVSKIDTENTYSRFLSNNSFGLPVATSNVEITTIDKSSNDIFYYYNGQFFSINITTSFAIAVLNSSIILQLGINSLSNENGSELYQGLVNIYTHYVKTENKVANTITYAEEEFAANPIWESLPGRAVYVVSNGFRYGGLILSIDTTDTPIDGTPEIERKIEQITLQLNTVEEYPVGIAEENEAIIFPQDNCSILLRDRLLNDTNRKYCNLINNRVYFAKSVESNLSALEQTAEVYGVSNNAIVPFNIESGGFVSIEEAVTIYGISYHPQI